MLSRCFENENEQNGQEYLKTDSLMDLGYHEEVLHYCLHAETFSIFGIIRVLTKSFLLSQSE